jgi:hypothetical protein
VREGDRDAVDRGRVHPGGSRPPAVGVAGRRRRDPDGAAGNNDRLPRPLAVYAATPFGPRVRAACAQPAVAEWLGAAPADLPRGAVVAFAQLVDVQPAEAATLTGLALVLGEASTGQHGWEFADVTALPTAVPVHERAHLFPAGDTSGVLTWMVPLGGDCPVVVPREIYDHYERVGREQRCAREHGPGCNQTRCLGFAYFANGTEFEIWQANWCERCKHDAAYSDDHPERGCQLLALALCGERIPEWMVNDTVGDPARQVTCLNFRNRDDPGGDEDNPTPTPPPPGQGLLFQPSTSRRMLVPLPDNPWMPSASPAPPTRPPTRVPTGTLQPAGRRVAPHQAPRSVHEGKRVSPMGAAEAAARQQPALSASARPGPSDPTPDRQRGPHGHDPPPHVPDRPACAAHGAAAHGAARRRRHGERHCQGDAQRRPVHTDDHLRACAARVCADPCRPAGEAAGVCADPCRLPGRVRPVGAGQLHNCAADRPTRRLTGAGQPNVSGGRR